MAEETTETPITPDVCAIYQKTGRIEGMNILQDAGRGDLIRLKGLVEADIALIKAHIEAGGEEERPPGWSYRVRAARGHKVGLLRCIESILAERRLEWLASHDHRTVGYLMHAVRDVAPEDLCEKIFARFSELCTEGRE